MDNLLSEAKSLGIDVSKVPEARLVKAVSDRRVELWLKENAEAIDSYNAYVEQQGLPLEKYRLIRQYDFVPWLSPHGICHGESGAD